MLLKRRKKTIVQTLSFALLLAMFLSFVPIFIILTHQKSLALFFNEFSIFDKLIIKETLDSIIGRL